MKNAINAVFAGFVVSVFLLGCSKLSRENYDKIKVGMKYQDVASIIGEPDTCDSALGAKSCRWGSKGKNITIKFVLDKVVVPSMKGL